MENKRGRPRGRYGPDVKAVVDMQPNRVLWFHYDTERDTQTKYRCMRRAVRQLGLDIIIRKVGHRIEAIS